MSRGRRKNRIQLKRRRTRIISLAALIILLAAWFYGYFNAGSEITPYLSTVLPQADQFEKKGNIFIGYNPEGDIIGYAAVSQSTGYGGPVQLLVSVAPEGTILHVKVVDHKETPGFFRLLPENRFFNQFVGKSSSSPLLPGNDIDAVSGATISSQAAAQAIRTGVQNIAKSELDKKVPPQPLTINFGVPELSLIVLYGLGFFGHQLKNKKVQKKIRWVTLLSGAVVLGFIYNKPLTLANITSFLAGYWPNWQTNLYWYLLLGGIFFVTTTQAKNPYCHWFCPFGSVQEILSTLTKAKSYRPRKYHLLLTWLQRGLAYFALTLGLALRMPGAASPEPFGALFNITGSWPQFTLLIVILLASLIVYRPFCSYLCPLHPVVDYIAESRRWFLDLWKKKSLNK